MLWCPPGTTHGGRNHMTNKKLHSTTEVAERAGVSRDTLLRWLKAGKIPEPGRNRNGWRVFTEKEARAVEEYANRYTPSPRRRQGHLFRKAN